MAKKSLKNAQFSTDNKVAFLQALDLFGDDSTVSKLDVEEEFTPTGSIVWDQVLRLKGIPRGGRIIQIHGKEHGGKSTLTYNICKGYQKATGQPVCIFDFEGTATGEYLRLNGVNTERDALVLFRENSVENCIKKTITLMKAGVKLFIFDSIPRMKSQIDEKEILSGQAFKASYGTHAKSMNMFFDVLLPYAQQYDCVFIMVNQIRARIEQSMEAQLAVKYATITNPNYQLPGGWAVKFYPSLTIEVSVGKALRAGGGETDWDIEPGDNKGGYVATRIKVRVMKNKVTMGGYREHILYLRPGLGLDDNISVRELAHKYKLIQNKGRKYIVGLEANPIVTYESKDEAIQDLVIDQNPTVLAKLRQLVISAIESDNDAFKAEISADERDIVEATDHVVTTQVKFEDEDDFE